MAIYCAILSSLFFGIALVSARIGLRTLDARAGASISIPTAALLFVLAAPFSLDLSDFDIRAALMFAAVGVFFPALVTLLTFRSNELLGPTVTGAVSGSAPLFALLASGLFLGEAIPAQAAFCAVGVVAGIALLSWDKTGPRAATLGWVLLWPLAGALVRGFAQVGAKAGLLIWANAFAAGLIGYAVSSLVVLGANKLRHSHRLALSGRSITWFVVTGVLNGSAVLLMYAALSRAPVWTVAPIVAAYPLVTALLSAVLLQDEKPSLRALTGAALTVGAVVYLVSLQRVAL